MSGSATREFDIALDNHHVTILDDGIGVSLVPDIGCLKLEGRDEGRLVSFCRDARSIWHREGGTLFKLHKCFATQVG